MKKTLLLLFMPLLCLGGSRALAAATVTWESYPGWVRNNVAFVIWVGITTPGTTSDTYKMSDFQFAQETGSGANQCYTAIATEAPTGSGATLDARQVLAVSSNSVVATATEYYTYNLASEIDLTGATTYYMVFLSSNTPDSDGKYTVTTQRISLNTGYGTYGPRVCNGSGNTQTSWTPGFKATLTTDAVFTVSYTCISTGDDSTIASGTWENVVGAVAVPSYDHYAFAHATTEDGTAFDISQSITEDVTLKLYYNPQLTYSYKFGATQLGTETVAFTVGSAYPTPSGIPHGFSADLPEGNVTAEALGNTIDVALTWTLFSYAANFDGISQWYKVRLHSNQNNYLYNNDGAVAFNGTAGGNDYLWGFVGDPVTGFQVYSYKGGADVALDNATPSALSADGRSVNFHVAYSNPGAYGAAATAYFALYATAGSYLNYQGGQIKRWGNNDEGSTFVIDEAEPILDFTSQVEREIQPFIDAAGEGYFKLSTDAAAALTAAINTAKQDGSVSESEYNDLTAALTGSIVKPSSGYYRIKSSGQRIGESYIGYGQPSSATAGLITVKAADAATDASTIIRLTASNGVYRISTQGMNVQQQRTGNTAFPLSASEGTDFTFTVLAPGIVGIHSEASHVNDNFNGDLHEAGWAVPGVVNWKTSDSTPSQWSIEKVESLSLALNGPIDGLYYATLCLPFTATIDGAEAYTLELNESKTGLKLNAVADNRVAAGTPVLLRGTTASATAAFTASAPYAEAPLADTALKGTFAALSDLTAETDYFLGTDGSAVGFYRWEGTTLKANRAYLPASTLEAGGSVKGFALNFDLQTGLGAMGDGERAQPHEPVYNLAGQRVGQPSRGLYIVGGRKVAVK